MFIAKSKISYPITLASDETFIKRSLSIFPTENDDNDYIDSLLESATDQTEGYINQDIAYTSNEITLDKFSGNELVIKQGNLNAITSIINNDSSTLITSFDVRKSYFDFTISFNPAINCESLTVKFTTGYDVANDIPKGLRQGILCKTLGLYDKTDTYEAAWKSLCDQYKLL
ncbi:MAG: hypothetical protein LLG13_11035 [Bacteroidales bacterium]|nr:hypothetical protein [Bacteroidales bacterium]